MNLNIIRKSISFVVLLLVQALVLGHVRLFGCATPMLYAYFVLPMQRGQAKWATLVWCFALGVAVDAFANTPGVAAASMTLAALLQPYLLELFAPRDSADDLVPSFRTLGVSKYVSYTVILVFIMCLTFFSLETFNLYSWMQWAACTLGSTAVTVILILVIENVRDRK